jgi:hypothetical protein
MSRLGLSVRIDSAGLFERPAAPPTRPPSLLSFRGPSAPGCTSAFRSGRHGQVHSCDYEADLGKLAETIRQLKAISIPRIVILGPVPCGNVRFLIR